MKKYFPIFVDLEKKDILVVGGGKIAYRKIKTLLNYGAKIEVITPKIVEEKINILFKENKIRVTLREFKESDIENRFLIIGATNNKELNKKIYELGDLKNILVNNITTKKDLNTKFSAIYRGENFQIAISTDEGNPKKALEIKNQIEKSLKN